MDYKNLDGFIGAIVAEARATLNELKTIYSLEDAFLLFETIAVTRYNEYLAAKHAQNKKR